MMDEFYHFPMTGPYTARTARAVERGRGQERPQKWPYLRPDCDFGMVWIKQEGKGRVFNSVGDIGPTST